MRAAYPAVQSVSPAMIAVSATNAPVWITTREASRIVVVTKAGQAGLREWLGIDLAELRAAA
jgi:hypothetical protein